ncbi:MAG: pyrrolysine--tRNA(Pyl) ligase small subunit [Deferrisomatales bacterium]
MGVPAARPTPAAKKKGKKTRFRKREDLDVVLQKVKLWPSRNGTLHGLRSVVPKGAFIDFTTHCGHKVRIRNSKSSRVARWLRNKWFVRPCPRCRVPQWKLDKFSLTSFQ